ncbi:LysR family transcriptional regulator [Azohydromonas lata]|uniref:LysR family transcriptional regulator n=1 Tax=Azohydromonas lata TaxID=45677 RepID=A0ABU5IDZ9_9BURK|nr:LysR family transcriptional regulator [Azohydromonas lata]MDZ5457336.1 LysR family transcriptional regulator [Azohydromonas lata]
MALSRFTLRQLEAFATVAELHSFKGTAERMGLTTQAVSQLIADFEAVLGFRLFDRTTRRVALTGAGRDFLGSVRTVLRHVHDAESAAEDVRQRAAGLVRVGAPMVLAGTALPAAIRTYTAEHPKVVVRIRDLPVDSLIDSVSAGDVDLAVGPDRTSGQEISSQALFDSPWVLWCSPDHPLAHLKQVRWADLRHHTLVAAGRDHELSVAQMRVNAPEDTRITPVDVVDNISTALGMATQGLAATLAPAYVGVMAARLGLVMKRVVEPETVRKVCLYQPLNRTLSPAAEGFAEYLAHWLQQWSETDVTAKPAA